MEERFWTKVDRTGDCWLWTAGVDQKGYGQIWVAGRCPRLAHRVAYELQVGAIPSGLCVLHTCDVPRCVRGTHLILGTVQENNADKLRKGRGAKGERMGLAKLTDSKVRRLRALVRNGVPHKVIAEGLKVSRSAVTMAASGRTWGHV